MGHKLTKTPKAALLKAANCFPKPSCCCRHVRRPGPSGGNSASQFGVRGYFGFTIRHQGASGGNSASKLVMQLRNSASGGNSASCRSSFSGAIRIVRRHPAMRRQTMNAVSLMSIHPSLRALYVCMSVCMYVCMCVCMYIYTCDIRLAVKLLCIRHQVQEWG